MFLRHCGLPLVLGFLFGIMVNNGWIKLYRKICENIIWQNEKALKIWIWCLLKANHKGKEVLIGRQKVKIKPGQFIFGSNKATQELNISKSTIHYWISFLISERYIERKIFPKYSIITILNWHKYQGVERKTDAGLNADETQSSPIKETNKNVKNDKNGKNIIYMSYKNQINQKSILTSNGKKNIQNCLRSFTEQQLLKAIDNKSKDSWFMAHNSNRGITWFFSSLARIARYIEEEPKKQLNNRIN